MKIAEILVAANAPIFDQVLRDTDKTLRDGGDLSVLIKDHGTEHGRPVVMLTFSVEVDGEIKRAQTVTTLEAFMAVARLIDRHYPNLGVPTKVENN